MYNYLVYYTSCIFCELYHKKISFLILFKIAKNQKKRPILLLFIQFVNIISWFAVLFTGKMPAGMHEFTVGTLRWGMRLSLYINFLSEGYPPFNGKP